MNTFHIKALAVLALATGLTGCGDDFLDTKLYNGVEIDTALDTPTKIGYALNGTYYRLFQYYFAGNYATTIGDVSTDVAYWNGKTNHWNEIYQYNPSATTSYLRYIWEYGYKVVDNSTRVILGVGEIYDDADVADKPDLDVYTAQAYALRGYARLFLVNVYGHQYKVAGADFGTTPGIVIADHVIAKDEKVTRATVGETYAAIESDLKNALLYFEKAGYEPDGIFNFTTASVKGLLSRVYLYEEKYTESATAAQEALDAKGINTLTYDAKAYKALYNGGDSNKESLFALAINSVDNWSANSCGNIWSTYNFSPSPWLQSILAEADVRRAVWGWHKNSTPAIPIFTAGKFGAFGLGGNNAYGTNYLINAPEMFLNIAESKLKTGDVNAAAEALLVVAKRNPAITGVGDLPGDPDALFAFLQDERARELFQEGLRLYDLRRWDVLANVNATAAPAIEWFYTGYKISDLVYAIPAYEINTNSGVEQNEWFETLPR